MHFFCEIFGDLSRTSDLPGVDTLFFIPVVVDPFRKNDFQDGEDLQITAVSQQADRELSAAHELFDQGGLSLRP